jgi:hypothetical protein
MAAAIGLRAWTLDARDYEDEAAFRAGSGRRAGLVGVPEPPARHRGRERADPPGDRAGQWITAGWTFRTATVPGVRLADTGDLPTVAADVADAAAEVLDEADDEPALEPEPADVSY